MSAQSNTLTYTAVIPAAGIGSRMQADVPKQYLPLGDITVIETTIKRLLAHPQIARLVVVLHPNDDVFNTLDIASSPRITRVIGGDERANSVFNGLQVVPENEWVLVHDAARPCVRHEDISKLLQLAQQSHGGILAKRVVDTMKRGTADNFIAHSEPRDHLWHALTPQFFPCAQLREALAQCLQQHRLITDEASAMEYAGHKVALVEGYADNIKITVPEDLALAEFYIKQQEHT